MVAFSTVENNTYCHCCYFCYLYILRSTSKYDLFLDTLYLILQYFIKYSYRLGHKKPFYVLKQNDFTKRRIEVEEYDLKKKKWNTRIETDFDFTRKIFQKHIDELIEKKFVVSVKSSDKRAKYYSITPLGILYALRHDELIRSVEKVNHRIADRIFPILEAFAFPYVRPYRSELFDKDMNFYEIKELLEVEGEELYYILTGLSHDSFTDTYDFKIKLLFDRPVEIKLATFDMSTSDVMLSEMARDNDFGNYKPIKLSDEQFHNYLAKLVCSAIIYFHFQIQNPKHIDQDKTDQIILEILISFNRNISRLFADMNKQLSSLSLGLV